MAGPIKDGIWQVTVMTDPTTPQQIYYRLHCQPDGTMTVDTDVPMQAYAGAYTSAAPGWTASSVAFADDCGLVSTISWCIYYEFTSVTATTMSGTTVIVGPAEYRFPATATWLGP